MKRKEMKSALKNSLMAEDEAVKNRFEQAERLLGERGVETDPPASKPKRDEPRTKVVRDSFTLPEDDHQKIADLKQRCLGLAKNVTKSEIVRAGLYALEAFSDEELLLVMSNLTKIKTGRPSQKE